MADEAGPSEKAKFTKDTEEVDIDPISGKRRVEGGGGRQGRRLTLFDRSSGSVLNPCFASSVLEAHYQRISYQQSVGRLRCACAYLALCSLVWVIYFAIRQTPMWWGLVLTEVATILVFVLLLGATYVRALFPRFSLVLSLIAVVVKGGLLLANMAALKGDEDYGYLPIFDFAGVLQVVMVSYTLIPIPLYLCLLYGILLSGLYILCLVFFIGVETPLILTSHAMMLIGVQIVGFQLHIMSQVRRRSTYLRLCEGARLKRDQAHEKESKDAMIKSLMPESVAKAITETGEGGTENGPSGGPGKSDAKFRKFYVKQLQDVSVLFADIVGFTNMSSGKTAPHLVYLLNDLFGRFDDLCDKSGCEKIATLGDCYYCVAGCPEPKPDHAECCVEMGRAMVEAIREFDRDHEEAVNMRVGVHTGTVTCGIVGKMRFKFDVWSNDVTLANEMESSGQPGRVHISDDTYNFVKDIYKLDEGPVVPDIRELKVLIEYYDETKKGYAIKHTQNEKTIKTYFVVERVDGRPHISLPKKNVIKFHDLKDTSAPPVDQDDVVVEVTGPSASGPTDQELTGMIGTDDSNLKAFYSPPVSQITLNFRQGSLESSYRRYGVLPDATDSKDAPAALSNPRVSPLIDSCVQLAMLLFVAAAGFLAAPLPAGIALGCIGAVVLILFLLMFCFDLCSNCASGLYAGLFSWYPRNAIGAFVMVAPAAVAIANLASCAPAIVDKSVTLREVFLLALCAFVLFTFFCSWTKSCTAIVAVILAIALTFLNPSLCSTKPEAAGNLTLSRNATNPAELIRQGEFTISVLELLLLVVFLNRLYDISFRQSFHCEHQAAQEKVQMRKEKEQADWLLHNIIPYYIETEMSEKKTYSRNLKNVGVVFSTIYNFSEFYDEQFQGGTEMLRVLNEYFSDIEGLLSNDDYKDVEKIKTVGACLMAASGLNTKTRKKNKDPDWDHLYALMDFCLDVLEQTKEFNEALFNFDFKLKIGYNIGEVTAGVIGSTKLLYDIWGDTVNVSSRMYSTGEMMRIQVTKDVAKKLESRYEFEDRGTTYVKGKGDVETCLLVKKR
ncbi:hypothetical protein BOX15_Mlig034349g17 [Macrostomum lignano]|nr:hypothetical protein BOX15_Mlig034349g17 [Macrostomum lignano]